MHGYMYDVYEKLYIYVLIHDPMVRDSGHLIGSIWKFKRFIRFFLFFPNVFFNFVCNDL